MSPALTSTRYSAARPEAAEPPSGRGRPVGQQGQPNTSGPDTLAGTPVPDPAQQVNGNGQGLGLFLGHNMAHTDAARLALPDPVPNWPELAGDVIGFRPAEACEIAAAWFPRIDTVRVIEAPVVTGSTLLLNDGTGRMVDTDTGEIVRLITGQEKRTGDAVAIRTLVIAGGKVAIECGQMSQAERALVMVNAEMEAMGLSEDLQSQFDELLDAIDALSDDAEVLDDEEDDGRPWNVVTGFSRKARQRLRQKVAEADWCTPLQREGTRIGMLTLTYPGDWEAVAGDPAAVTAHRHALERRLERALGYVPPFFWVREFQHRGAPHFHLAGVFPTRINGERLEDWLSRNWYEIVASGDPKHLEAGTGVDWAQGLRSSDPNRLAAYFSAYSTGKGGKEYQHHPPEGWCNDNGSAGRHWGYRGVTFVRSEVRVSRDQMIEIQRFLRRYIASQKRTMRTRGANGQRSRPVNRRWRLRSLVGLDAGFTLLTNDGPALAIAIARAITQQEDTWPPGQRRPLP